MRRESGGELTLLSAEFGRRPLDSRMVGVLREVDFAGVCETTDFVDGVFIRGVVFDATVEGLGVDSLRTAAALGEAFTLGFLSIGLSF